MTRFVLILILGALAACSGPDAEDFERSADSSRVAGPIETLRCSVDDPFVRTGGVARVLVDARDSRGVVSNAFELVITPSVGTRITQRTKIIFDEPGDYSVSCRSLNTEVTDTAAIRVGPDRPALAVEAPAFTTFGTVQLRGRAHSARGAEVVVKVDDQAVVTQPDGRFALDVAVVPGVNRFETIATDADGRTNSRLAWTLAGSFGEPGQESSDAVIVGLRPASFADIQSLLVDVVARALADPEMQASMLESSSGSNFGTKWEYHPTRMFMGRPQVTLSPRRSSIAVQLVVPSVRIDGWARTRILRWKTRDVQVTARSVVVNTELATGPGGAVILRGTRVQINGSDVEISGLPGFVESIILRSMQDDVAGSIRRAVDVRVADAITEMVQGFTHESTIPLPSPLRGELFIDGRVSNLWANASGLQIGLGVAVSSDTLPRWASAPGPWKAHTAGPRISPSAAPIQAAVGENALNAVLYAAWSTGGLEMEFDAVEALPETDKVNAVWVFVDPLLPPTLEATDGAGKLELRAGAVQVDVVIESDLGVVNGSFLADATGEIALTSDGTSLTATVTLTDATFDMLIAPEGLEAQAIESLLIHILAEQALPELASVTRSFPIPETDLSRLELPGRKTLQFREVEVNSPADGTALDITGHVRMQ